MKKYYIIYLIFIFCIVACEIINGEYSLGNHLWLWDNDKEKTAIIVYCEGDCYGGIYVVPSYKKHYDSLGRYVEYVLKAKSDKNWVIAKTYQINDKKENYYIISKNFDIVGLDCAKSNCDSILQSHVMGPFSLSEFEDKKKVLKIELDFK